MSKKKLVFHVGTSLAATGIVFSLAGCPDKSDGPTVNPAMPVTNQADPTKQVEEETAPNPAPPAEEPEPVKVNTPAPTADAPE